MVWSIGFTYMKKIHYLIIIIVVMQSSFVFAKKDEINARAGNSLKPASLNFGTGWLVSPGFIVTNNHVVAQHERAVIIRTDKSEYNTRVLVRDVANDIALLKIVDDITLPAALPLADRSPAIGEQVFTIGYPHPDVMGSNPKLSVGIINARTGLANDPRLFQISTPLQAGNSGGPLINMQGEVVGIVTSKLNAMKMFKWTGDIPQTVNYAVKINYLRTLIELFNDEGKQINTLPRQQNNLVSLSRMMQDSIVIIKSGVVAAKIKPPVAVIVADSKKTIPKPMRLKSKKIVSKVALFTFMSNGGQEKNGGNDSTDVYSTNTAAILKGYFEKDNRSSFKVTYNLHGRKAEGRYYKVYSKNTALDLCRRLDVDYLISVKNDHLVSSSTSYHENLMLC